jgi:type I restriction enzyme S subunit
MSSAPTGWANDRLKDVAAINVVSLPADTDADYEFDYLEISNVDYHGIVDPKAIERLRFEDAPSRARRCVAANNTVMSSVRPNLQAVAFVADFRSDFVCSTGFNVVGPRPTKLSSKFAYYVLISEGTRQYLEAAATGVGYPAVGDKEFNSIDIPLPPLPEQQRIAAYLDISCAAIDAAVAAKRRQLETLDALRETTIHRAVTCGVALSVKMKHSGVEWFDKIPAHWRVDRLKDVAAAKKDAIKVGPFGSDLLLGDMTEEGVKVYNQRTVIDRDFNSGIHFISPEKYAEMTAFTVYPQDLLITTRGTIGRCAIVPETAQLGILHPCLMRVQTSKAKLLPEYLAVLIQDCALVLRQLQMMSAATTIDVIYSDSLKRTYLPLPPVEEQRTILSFIREKQDELRTLSVQIEHQITTLTAYRKSLIHECVTGQRRVTDQDVRRAEKRRL